MGNLKVIGMGGKIKIKFLFKIHILFSSQGL